MMMVRASLAQQRASLGAFYEKSSYEAVSAACTGADVPSSLLGCGLNHGHRVVALLQSLSSKDVDNGRSCSCTASVLYTILGY